MIKLINHPNFRTYLTVLLVILCEQKYNKNHNTKYYIIPIEIETF